jgi:hypothetical protein
MGSTGSTGSKPAASSPLQGAGLAETGLLRAVQQHAGAAGAAALSLAWRPDHGTGGRIQRPFLGLQMRVKHGFVQRLPDILTD